MMFSTPAHKQTDPAKKPGQIVNPIDEDAGGAMDDTIPMTEDERQIAKLYAPFIPQIAA
jgi:hypothetical protein